MNIFKKLRSHNWMATFYFNFKMLPFKQAIRFPFVFYYKVRFENLSGEVKLNVANVRRGMIKIGGRGSEMFTRTDTIIDLKGRAIFHGVVELGHGCLLRVEKSAIVTFGQDVRLGALTKIFCVESISFGNEIDFSWECQIFDSNFHYIRDLNSGAIRPITSPVTIGSYNWFGNNVDIMKGARTPDHLICASNSLCNKDYGDLAHHCVIGGYPAELLASNRQRVFENLEDVGSLIVYSCLEVT